MSASASARRRLALGGESLGASSANPSSGSATATFGESPTTHGGVSGGKAAQDAVATLAAEASAAAASGPQALIDFAAARLAAFDEADDDEDAHEA